ncbi:hypothetical protein J4218_05980 [Candidatus Pacearchaeota archaeon]|nr:hypothetical protein [Candidatus Pacearchaeota archaeon]
MNRKKKDLQGIIFLRLFTKEILIKLIEREESKQNIELEKVKQKIFPEQPINPEEAFRSIISQEEGKRKVEVHREHIPMNAPIYPILSPITTAQKPKEVIKPNPQGMEKSISQSPEKISEKQRTTQQRVLLNDLLKRPIQKSNLSPMQKIDPLLRDNTILVIECPGKGKNILIKKYNQINTTKIILTEEEINSIIDFFSKESRIPLTGGILKAALNNYIISAVTSEFVGSRFVINKITPYSLISNN